MDLSLRLWIYGSEGGESDDTQSIKVFLRFLSLQRWVLEGKSPSSVLLPQCRRKKQPKTKHNNSIFSSWKNNNGNKRHFISAGSSGLSRLELTLGWLRQGTDPTPSHWGGCGLRGRRCHQSQCCTDCRAWLSSAGSPGLLQPQQHFNQPQIWADS